MYFTDQNLDRIMRWGTDGILTQFMLPSGRANGMYMDADGCLVACSDAHNELWKIAPDGSHTVLLAGDAYNERFFNGPNDVWVHPDGSIYFTDPLYSRPWWTDERKGKEMDGKHVYRFDPKSKKLERLTTDLKQPNGIVGTSDGKQLYVSDIDAGVVLQYQIAEDGSLTDKKVFCKDQSDGMTMDCKGNVYLSNGAGVVIYDKTGKKIENIKVPEGWTANVCFGGKNHDILFITASKGFYCIKMQVKGENPGK